MRRKLFTVAAAISLVLCLAVAWTWGHPRSSGGVRHVIMEIPVAGHVVELSDLGDQQLGDRIIIGWLPGDYKQIEAQAPPTGISSTRSSWGLPRVLMLILVQINNGERAVGIMMPPWFLFLLAAALPLVWTWRWARKIVRNRVRARRRKSGLCLACAYDLRGTPQRCPECGEAADFASPPPHDRPLERTAAVV